VITKYAPLFGFLLSSAVLVCGVRARADDAPAGAFKTPIAADNLDPAVFVQATGAGETPLAVKEGPRHVLWTRNTAPEWDGVRFGASKEAGPRYLRIGFKAAVAVGAVLTRGGGALSVLKPAAGYPGRLTDDADWIPAERLKGAQVCRDEVGEDEYAVWVLPRGTVTCALRFTHIAAASDPSYSGWLGGASVLAGRMANIAPQATAAASARDEDASRINNGLNDRTWGAWDNGPDGAAEVVSPRRPAWVILTWPREVRLRGLNALWAGFAAAEVQRYDGPPDRHPRDGVEGDWKTIKSFSKLENQYPRALGVNWMDFGEEVTTRAVRLRITAATKESHPHLQGKTYQGKRVWLGELAALSPLGDADLKTAVLPSETLPPPPIPVRFILKEAGYVTLVLEDGDGKRVRNLVSETWFPAGDNVVWWDGTNDLLRDVEAARHGVYHVPAQLVAPGAYHVRGLVRKGIDLRYEFTVYNPGRPPWPTADHTGGWLANHTAPGAALFVPGERAPGGKPLVYLGSYVSEGGDGLAWVDLEGRKLGGQGHVGGSWTGAPYLARDVGDGPTANVFAYVGSAWEGDLRLTALTKTGDKTVAPYKFAGGKEASAIAGLAVRNGLLVCSLPKQNQLLLVDARAGKVTGTTPLDDPRGLAFDARGRLLALSGKRLLRYNPPEMGKIKALPAPEAVVSEGLDDPQQLALDAQGNVYVSDRGNSHQVKVFDAEGKLLRMIGRPGAPTAGSYDPDHMNNPTGLTIDSNDHLWVAETDFQPKRVSVWTLDGKRVNAFYGPAEYGGGGALDPRDKTRFYYHGMELKLDWEKGTSEVARVLFRPGPKDLQLPGGHDAGQPETPLYIHGKRYFTNCYNSNPTNGAGVAFLWQDREGVAIPVAALGRANDWDLLKTDAFKSLWPKGVDLKGDYWANQAMFIWTDLNGDGLAQPDEVMLVKKSARGVTVMPDLSYLASYVDGAAVRYAPKRFTDAGAPVYDLAAGEPLVQGAQTATSSGGEQALLADNGWAVLTVAPKPFAPQSVGGAFRGEAKWSYPSLWPGLHASHESPPPEAPGEIIGTTRLLGGFVTPKAGDAGPLWAVNGNMGDMYLFTADGLFVATLFKDVRQGKSWAMPGAERGMILNDLTLHDENFWPSMTQTEDGRVYLVDGANTSLVRVDGLESIRRLPECLLSVSADNLRKAQDYLLRREELRQKNQGKGVLTVALREKAPVVDGKLDDWVGADWVDVDKSGVAANFDSHSKPFNVTAAVSISGDRLYAAFRTGDPDLLHNSGETATAPFRTGGALDLMIGTDPGADPKREKPAAGDVRLVVTRVKDKTWAVLYRPVAPGIKEPVPFSSPWRTITIDKVEDVSDQVRLAGAGGDYELSVPLETLGLKPAAGQTIRGDVGVLRGDGFQTLRRVYWSNKATGLTSDVPSEAMLTPHLWGRWEFK
jgi:NHL repeat